MPDFARGVAMMAAAALTFASMHGLIWFAAQDIHPFEVAFFRWFFGVIFLLPFIVRTGPSIWKTEHRKLYVIRAIMTSGATMVWFFALTVLPLAQATALNFTIALFTTLGAALFLGEHVGLRRWAATIIGFAGVMVILRPGVDEVSPAALLPVAAAIMIAVNLNIVKFTGRTDSTLTVVVYNAVLSLPLTAVPLFFVWQTPSWTTLGLVAIVAFFATIAHFLLTKAFTYGDASALIPVDYLRLPFIALIGFVVFSEVPDIWTWVGGAIIAAATIYIARREVKLARLRDDVTEKLSAKTE